MVEQTKVLDVLLHTTEMYTRTVKIIQLTTLFKRPFRDYVPPVFVSERRSCRGARCSLLYSRFFPAILDLLLSEHFATDVQQYITPLLGRVVYFSSANSLYPVSRFVAWRHHKFRSVLRS